MYETGARDAAGAGEREELVRLAHQRLQTVVLKAETTTTLDSVMQRLFDRDHRELLTYSAFGSSL
ncbi:hypothetical protein ABT297_15110 [Dactylosporangium sp. NPDC000555]|uniref:hypothetical protein n=1 Tax=Dactylosporangium sp. NPDC000555 TaxID=3154260 RepID=UPI003328053C